MRLSAAPQIPGFFVPIDLDGRLLVDGGLVDNLPFSALSELGATMKIGVNVNRWISKRRPKNILDVVTRSLEIMTTYRYLPGKNEILIEPHLEAFTPSDFNKADGLMEEGYRAATASIKEIRIMAGKRSLALASGKRSNPFSLNSSKINKIPPSFRPLCTHSRSERRGILFILLPVTTSTSSVTTTFAAGRAGFKRLGLVHGELASTEILTIPHFDRFLRIVVGAHFDKPETARAAGHLVHDDARGHD